MTNGLSKFEGNGAPEGAIAPQQQPAPGGGRLSKGKGRKQQIEVPTVNVEAPRQQYQEMTQTVLNTAAGQLAETVETVEETLTMMEEGTAAFLSERVSGSAARVMSGVTQATGGMNNAAFFRSDAQQFASDFVASLRRTNADQ
jgi:hypothetical protein